jgi:transposase
MTSNRPISKSSNVPVLAVSDRLQEKTDIKVSIPTMCRLVQKLNLTRKKNTSC